MARSPRPPGLASATTGAYGERDPLVRSRGANLPPRKAPGTITFQTNAITVGSGTGLQFSNADGTYNFIDLTGTWRIEGNRLIETQTDPGESGDPAANPAREGERRGEQVRRQPHALEDGRRIELHVRLEAATGLVLLQQRQRGEREDDLGEREEERGGHQCSSPGA